MTKTACDAADPVRWRRRTQLLIVLLLLVRWLYAAIVPLELVADEAYYWDWSRQLDWGYYSKPPLIAWIIRLATEIGGSTAWTVRSPAVLLGTLGLWWIYLVAERLFSARTGFWAATLGALTPGNAALSLLMTIDAPFLFCWGMGLYGLWRMLERGPQRAGWIVVTGLAVGLGLLAKESMIAFLMAAWLFVLVSPADRCELQRPGWWLMTVLALACLAPVIVWNSRNRWITLQHSSTHFEPHSTGIGQTLLRSGEFVASQIGMISPVTFVVFMAAGGLAVWRWRNLTRSGLFLFCFSLVPLMGVFALSLTRRVMPNWPAPFYAAGLIFTAAWLTGQAGVGEMPRVLMWLFPSRDRVLRRSVWSGAACAGLVCLTPWAVHWLGLAGSKLDATVRLRGWSQFAEQVARSQQRTPHPESTFVYVATGRQETSELAFYLPGQPRISLWNPGNAKLSQYDLWPGPTDKSGWDALIVAGPRTPIDPAIARRFREVAQLPSPVDIPLGNGRRRQYAVWLGRDFRAPTDSIADPAEPSTMARDSTEPAVTR